jgi:O-antigen ligase
METTLIALAAILVYILFQLVPLPLSLVGILHPGMKEIVTLSPKVVPVYHSISLYPFVTELALSGLVIYFMVFSMALFGIERRHSFVKVIKALAVFGCLLALFGIIQKATGNGKLYWFRELTQGGSPFGPFVNRNHFAGFINMIIFLSLGIALRSRKTERKVLYAFLTVVMALSLFLSLSRGGIVSFFAGLATFIFVILTQSISKKRLIPIFLFVLALGIYLFSFGISPVIERFAQTEVSHEQRLVAWQGTLSAFKDFPLFGSGLGTFEHVFKIYQPEGLIGYYDHAHNDYLELLLETGIFGVLIGGFFFVFVLRGIFKKEWQDREIYLKAGFLSSLATMAVHSAFDFNLHIPSNALLFFLILGMAVSFGRTNAS